MNALLSKMIMHATHCVISLGLPELQGFFDKGGVLILTYQDWLSATSEGTESNNRFILTALKEYTNSELYNNALVAQAYYRRRNIEIMRRRDTLLSTGELSKLHKKATRPVNKKCCGFFPKSVNQLNMYLLGNGVSVDARAKSVLGRDFDTTLQRIGRHALVDGVCWGYWQHGNVIPFGATEFFALQDERSSEYKVGFRFFQIDDRKPQFIEVFEVDGMSVYRNIDGVLSLETEKQPYVTELYTPKIGETETILSSRNYGVLPVIPFWASDGRESMLSEGLKNDIDLYDRVMSDFGDNLDRANDIYYVVQNYGGANLKQLTEEIEEYRTIYTDGSNSGAEIKTMDVPYEARKTALSLLERQMYKETQTLDTEELTGGGLTNVAIKVAMTELDLKADMFEWQAESFVRGILSLACPEADISVSFKRRSLINDAEMIQNIYTMREDIDKKTALELNPLLSEDTVRRILLSLTEEDGKYEN